jgi:hypothetical protein
MKATMSDEERHDNPNAPVTPIPEPPPGLRAGLGFHPAGSRTPPPVTKFATSTTRLVVLALIVSVVVVALWSRREGKLAALSPER